MKKIAGLLIVNCLLFFLLAKPVIAARPPNIRTALGEIPPDPLLFVGWVLGNSIRIGGGIAFLLMVFAGFQITTSTGNPERLKGGQEMLTAAIEGILFLIFSAFLLNLIGVKIFNFPDFS
ncbi:MAG: hypothetical protein ABH807_00105 [Candidatus Shapirobacteria bacterium]